jgi:alpha-amylase/alpha-mannosidase (GH57 family)
MMSQQKKLSIAFYWHMHQPIYQLSDDGDFLMPWVRLHAIKDYIDMVTILDNFEKLKLNINLVPALLSGIIKYGEKDFHDIHSRLTVMDIDKLNDSDKEFILNNFF